MDRINRPQSLTELVYLALKGDIVGGELKMGDTLSEARIAARLNVSRTPVREAFARLELEGLLSTEPQRGTYVFTMESDALRKICDTRVALETTAMRAAFVHAPSELVEALQSVVSRMKSARGASDDQLYLQLDTQFHQTLFDHSDNRFLDDAYQTIASKMAALRNRLGDHPPHMAKSFKEHVRMVDLLAKDKIDDAVTVLAAHIGRKEGSYWNT
ncbi:MAG: GntR family transcriptional regulator [Devosia sp.]